MASLYIIVMLLLSFSDAVGQSYFFKKYGVQEGLPSDIIKACTQDSLGYFWITSDEGVSKYDGVKFTNYPSIAHSNYFKGFLQTRNRRLLVYGDLDLYEIQNAEDTVWFHPLVDVTRVESDSSISFPKNVYEDKSGSLWIIEAESIVRMVDSSLKRYEFGSANRTTQFLRSFAIFEDSNDDLFVISYTGNAFIYNRVSDVFVPYPIDFPPQIEYAEVIESTLIIGSSQGIFTSELKAEGGFLAPIHVQELAKVSFIKKIDHERFFIATRESTHYFADQNLQTITPLPYKIADINNVYLSEEQDIWISSNDGLILLRQNLFQPIGSEEHFIEALAEDPETGTIYYADANTLFKFNPQTLKNELILQTQGGYFQDLLYTSQGLWIANAFKVYLLKDGEIVKEYDFSDQTQFISDLNQDSKGNIWVTIQESGAALKITDQLQLDRINLSANKTPSIYTIKEGPAGIYITASGPDSYLYFKSDADSTFRNISIPVSFDSPTNFEVNNLVFRGDDIYLASSVGLLRYSGSTVQKLDLGEFSNLPFRSIELYQGNKVLLSSAFGLLVYDLKSGITDLFNESYGLSSRTISVNGILVGANKKVWVGTSKGLCYSSRSPSGSKKTKTPRIIDVKIDGQSISWSDEIFAAYNDFVSITVSSITFPEKDVNYQYKFSGDETWTNFSNELDIPSLDPGEHLLQIRAEKYGPFTWSDINSIYLKVNSPYWYRWWFIASLIATITLIIWIIYLFVEKQNRIKNLRLQVLVDKKTKMLQIANEDLKSLNEEKNGFISLVAHDLKSPLSQILGLVDLIIEDKTVSEDHKALLTMIKRATNNQVEMIHKILNVNQIESKKIAVEIEAVDLSKLLANLVDQNIPKASKKEITIIGKISSNLTILSDKGYILQIMDNLLSNAIKFSPKGSTVYLKAIWQNSKAVCEVRDEGPGIPKNDQKKLFKKYQRLSAKPTGNESSTGLGLSIVKRFAKSLGADIWVESEVGKGTSFFLAFPKNRR